MLIEGFEQNGAGDGQLMCPGTLSGEREKHTIRRNRQIWWHCSSTMYDEWEPYCRACALIEANRTY